MKEDIRSYVEETRRMALYDYIEYRKRLFGKDEDVSNHELYNAKYLNDNVSLFVLGMESEEAFFAKALEECSHEEAFGYIDWNAVRKTDRTLENIQNLDSATIAIMYLYDIFLSISGFEKEKLIIEQINNSIERSTDAFNVRKDLIDQEDMKNLYTQFHEDCLDF